MNNQVSRSLILITIVVLMSVFSYQFTLAKEETVQIGLGSYISGTWVGSAVAFRRDFINSEFTYYIFYPPRHIRTDERIVDLYFIGGGFNFMLTQDLLKSSDEVPSKYPSPIPFIEFGYIMYVSTRSLRDIVVPPLPSSWVSLGFSQPLGLHSEKLSIIPSNFRLVGKFLNYSISGWELLVGFEVNFYFKINETKRVYRY